MTVRVRAAALRVCAALYGLAVAAALYPHFIRPAPPGQLPGLMSQLGLDAHAPFQFIATVIALAFVFTLALRPVAEVLARDDTRAWARNAAAVAMISALWTVMLVRDLPWVAIPPALVVLTAVFLRRHRARFRRDDSALIPTALALFIALIDATTLSFERCVIVAVIATFALRLLTSAYSFALAPLALVAETHFLGRDQRYLGWPAMAIIVITPFVLRFSLRTPRAIRIMRLACAWLIFPIACYSYLSASSLFTAEGKVRVSVFEEAQHITPAAEMMRGEHAYRDIIPPHGLIQDGLLDYLIMRHGARDLGQLIKARGTIGALNAVAQYTLGVAMTGSAPGGLASFFLAMILGQGGGTLRIIPALFTLAILIQAVRRRRARLLAYGAAGVVLAFMTSLDFGVYSGFALVVAIACFRGARLRALREAVIGGAAATIISAMALAFAGILGDFIRVTFTEVLTLGPVYALTPFDAPQALATTHMIPDLLATIFDRGAFQYLIWIAVLVFFAIVIAAPPKFTSERRRARFDAFIVLASFIVVCAISYAERHHLYYMFVIPAFLAGVMVVLRRSAAPLIALIAIILGTPTTHLGIVAWLRHSRGPVEQGLRELTGIPRARNALFWAKDADTIEASHRYIESHLAPNETFFDFTNRGLLYYLFDRDCPIRQIEPAFYEPERLQREVIAHIEANPRIRIVMVPPTTNDMTGVDLVPNQTRAPLVWKYLQEHFTPDFEEGAVAFWKRK
jgi:hypothetical protein